MANLHTGEHSTKPAGDIVLKRPFTVVATQLASETEHETDRILCNKHSNALFGFNYG
jgi:hypothetical protein